jgi:hypothetical protein
VLTTSQVRSPVFDRLTGRLAPALRHPTARAFDIAAWKDVIAGDMLGERDVNLVRAAKYVGHVLGSIREDLVAGLFDGISGDQVVAMAVANANRGWNIFRWKLHNDRPPTDGGVAHLSALGREGIAVGPDGAATSPDDANNALVDGLPYWFAEAAAVAADAPAGDLDMEAAGLVMGRGHFATNMMQAFRSIWQEVLWEPWSFDFDERAATLAPLASDDLARWKAWDWREQTLIGQSSLLSRNLEKDATSVPIVLPRTAVAIGEAGIAVGPPTDAQAASHRSAFENVERTYAAPFLDEPLGGRADLTARLVESAVCLLQDLVDLAIPRNADPVALDETDPRRLACSYPRAWLFGLLADALAIAPDLAEACLDWLTSDPFGELNPLFTLGVWHRPLVRSRDGGTLSIVAGALVWGSPLRRVERWLQVGARSDLSKTPAGLRHEAALRKRVAEAIGGNALLAAVPTAVSSIGQGEAEEEIDLLVRVGGTVLVAEVKCLLGPSEPIERHDYVRKLEEACEQAARKSAWLAGQPGELVARLGDGADGCRLQPLVVVNQSSGVEWEYDGAPITDDRFLRLLLGDGEYVAGGRLHRKPGLPPELVIRELYADAAGLEAAIPAIFRRMPGMDPFRDSVKWDVVVMEMPGGSQLRLGVPRQDPAAYVSAMEAVTGGSAG